MAASRKTNINSPTAGMRPSRPVRCDSYYGSTFVDGQNLFRLIDVSDNESTVGLVVVFLESASTKDPARSGHRVFHHALN